MKSIVKKMVSIKTITQVFIFIVVFSITSLFLSFLIGNSERRDVPFIQNAFFLGGNVVLLAGLGVFIIGIVQGKTFHKHIRITFNTLIIWIVLILSLFLNGTYFLVTRHTTIINPKPVVINHVNTDDYKFTGFIKEKVRIGERHLLVLDDGNSYLVPKEVYDTVKIGDPAPDFLSGSTPEKK